MERKEKLQLVIEQLEERIAPGVKLRGDNGWGNGAEGTNPGSDDGGTASSKIDESLPGGPGPDKFSTR